MAERVHPYVQFRRGEQIKLSELRVRSHGLIPEVRDLIASGQATSEKIENGKDELIQMKLKDN